MIQVLKKEASEMVEVSSETGLSSTQAVARLKTFGPNELPNPDRRNFVRIVWDVVRQPMFALQALAVVTTREREVFDQIVAGRPNKIAAYELGISPRTVEIHRAHVMSKIKVLNLADLVRISLACGAQQ